MMFGKLEETTSERETEKMSEKKIISGDRNQRKHAGNIDKTFDISKMLPDKETMH